MVAGGVVASTAIASPVRAAVPAAARTTLTSPRVVRPALFREAMAALQAHGSRIAKRDRIAIADFAASSSVPRFHLIDLASGRTETLLVAHGSGSDPRHSGFLQRFSNLNGSNASCEGAFLASDYYVGKHGKSQRLVGLDPTNDNALSRAIVIHGAWYSNAAMLRTHGKLGRSQGCFAVGESELVQVFEHLGNGRMVYAAKV
ncbi:murein L,D-transpeptidase catalytic domain family protein [Sphingomonas sp. ac-8]|uniref:murein L,D-transpeptidase catalytic domain family protein n=1 Tax=Sphingomonas sp. ac-8 TaxID=3242977 RepID=UPI003A80A75E